MKKILTITIVITALIVFNGMTAWNWLGKATRGMEADYVRQGQESVYSEAIDSPGTELSFTVEGLDGEEYTVAMIALPTASLKDLETATTTQE